MPQENIISEIRRELKENIDEKYRKGSIIFFKEKIKPYSVRIPVVRQIARNHFSEIKELDFDKTIAICEELLESGWHEETTIAFAFINCFEKSFNENTINLFEKWIEKYVHNWAHCDDFCPTCVGSLVQKYPQLTERIFSWTDSKNRWMKRASTVTYVLLARRGLFLEEILRTAEKLLHDEDDLVQKGVGWMLKEYTNCDPKPIIAFVDKHKETMPRTTLRYAIEKLPQET
ncbi:MAG: DNA alkylation repair protein, partial [Nanoarchaeota archaeon]|nr:DNA alkylation repair protein [Nanoarchaeota archaeon]